MYRSFSGKFDDAVEPFRLESMVQLVTAGDHSSLQHKSATHVDVLVSFWIGVPFSIPI